VTASPDAGTALSVTVVPEVKVDEQFEGQLIPAGELVTDPEPWVATVNANDVELGCVTVNGGSGCNTTGRRPKLALTDASALTVQVPVPEHAPPHPSNASKPLDGVAVSVTDVPTVKAAEQVEPQLIRLGLLDTLPGPVTDTETVKRWSGIGMVEGWMAAWLGPIRRASAAPAGPGNSTHAASRADSATIAARSRKDRRISIASRRLASSCLPRSELSMTASP
jgi:hypothetical protein